MKNLIIEKVPHYFNGTWINKDFNCYKDFYDYYYDIFCFTGLSFLKKGTTPLSKQMNSVTNVVYGSFLVPSNLIKSRDEIGTIQSSKQVIYSSFRKSLKSIIGKNYLKENVELSNKTIIISNVDYSIIFYGFLYLNDYNSKSKLIDIETSSEFINYIKDLTIRNLSGHPLRHLYI